MGLKQVHHSKVVLHPFYNGYNWSRESGSFFIAFNDLFMLCHSINEGAYILANNLLWFLESNP